MTTPILQQRDRDAVQQRLDAELKQDVNITLYTQQSLGGLYIPGRECRTCASTQQLLEEVSELSPRLNLNVVDYYKSQDEARAHGVDKIPAIIIGGDSTDSVKYYGLPSGLEFAVLLDTLIAASGRDNPLKPETRHKLKKLKEDIHIQVFVTPT